MVNQLTSDKLRANLSPSTGEIVALYQGTGDCKNWPLGPARPRNNVPNGPESRIPLASAIPGVQKSFQTQVMVGTDFPAISANTVARNKAGCGAKDARVRRETA